MKKPELKVAGPQKLDNGDYSKQLEHMQIELNDLAKWLQSPNQWPEWIPGFQPRAEHFPEAVDSLGRYIIQLIAMSATGATP